MGSEMCIRDSIKGGCDLAHHGVDVARQTRGQLPGRGGLEKRHVLAQAAEEKKEWKKKNGMSVQGARQARDGKT